MLLDPETAFDRAPHQHLMGAARKLDYPMAALRLSIAAYKLGHVVGVAGDFSTVIWPRKGIAAEPSHASLEMKVLMVGAFDAIKGCVPSAGPAVCVVAHSSLQA